MTPEQIKIIDKLEVLEKQGHIVDVRWSFCGYKCIVWEIHNDHDSDINIGNQFNSKWDAYKAALKYLNN